MSLIPETHVGRGEPLPESHPLTHECILGHEHTHTQHTIHRNNRKGERVYPVIPYWILAVCKEIFQVDDRTVYSRQINR